MAPLAIPSDGDYSLCSPRTNNMLNATATPPWHTSQIHQSESSMRSTLSAPSGLSSDPVGSVPFATPNKTQRKLPTPRSIQSFINPQNLVKEPAPARPTWTPINGDTPAELAAGRALRLLDRQGPQPVQYPKTPTDTAIFKQNYQRFIPDFDIDMNEIEVEEELLENRTTSLRLDQDWQVDKEDGRMYHIGHQPGATYSGTLANDDPNDIGHQAEAKIVELKEGWARPGNLARSKELFRLANKHIYYGGSLLLQRASFVVDGERVMCERPGCKKTMEPNTYYLALDEDTSFCVHCFELLWIGEYTGGLPQEHGSQGHSSRRDSAFAVDIPQLDGAFDRLQLYQPGLMQSMHADAPEIPTQPVVTFSQPGLMQSMHAFSDDELDLTPPPVCTPKRRASIPDAEDDYPDSPGSLGSTDSNEEWRYPPTRFQSLYKSIEPGATLSATDRAVLDLWKFVSMEQLRWKGHLARSDARRAFQAGEATEDKSLGMATITSDTAEEEVQALMTTTGMRKKDCQGRDLSLVLKEAVEIQKQRKN